MLHVRDLPYLTKDMPGIGGKIKTVPEDFVVEEMPLYEASGRGTHVYFQIEKNCLSTIRAVQDIARALGRPARDIGFAGLKDADAVTRQMLSIEHVDPKLIQKLSIPRIRILSVSLHGNKLKLGHLAGNRFTIKIRGVDDKRDEDVRAIMETLTRCGVPNYFGPQRFGMRGDTWEIGRAMLKQDYDEALAVMLGRPGPYDYDQVRRARELFDNQDYQAAARLWPGLFRDERRACRIMADSNGNARRAFGAVDKKIRRLFISAFQSQLFNQIVAQRIESLDRIVRGDLAWLHSKGAVFLVEDPSKEQPRCTDFEISATGPLFGRRMTKSNGDPGMAEEALLARENMTLDDWRDPGKQKIRGGRRPIRFKPHDVGIDSGRDDAGYYVKLDFFLESGCYATTVLREICKSHDYQTSKLPGKDES